MAEIVKCDRCKKFIKSGQKALWAWGTLLSTSGFDRLDLCPKCAKSFTGCIKNFLKK